MKIGDLVRPNKFANWSARQSKFGFVLEVMRREQPPQPPVLLIQVLLDGIIKTLPANHFEVIS